MTALTNMMAYSGGKTDILIYYRLRAYPLGLMHPCLRFVMRAVSARSRSFLPARVLIARRLKGLTRGWKLLPRKVLRQYVHNAQENML